MCASLIALGLLAADVEAQAQSTQSPASKEAKPHEPMPVDKQETVSPLPAEGHWQLEMKPGDFRLYTDPETGDSFWYFTYKVINRTGQDRWWGPKLELMDDRGTIMRAGKDVPVIITKRIEALIGNPLLQDQYEVLGEIKQGEAHAKEGFVVWPAGAKEATELHLFIRGMSSETSTIPDSKSGEPRVLHKSMRLNYRVSGDPAARGSQPVECELTQWIMR